MKMTIQPYRQSVIRSIGAALALVAVALGWSPSSANATTGGGGQLQGTESTICGYDPLGQWKCVPIIDCQGICLNQTCCRAP